MAISLQDTKNILTDFEMLRKKLDAMISVAQVAERNAQISADTILEDNVYKANIEKSIERNESNDIKDPLFLDIIDDIYVLKKSEPLVIKVKAIKEEYDEEIKSLKEKVEKRQGSFKWFFTASKDKKVITDAYKRLIELRDGSYGGDIAYYFNQFNIIQKADESTIWSDFFTDKKTYLELLKKAYPDINKSAIIPLFDNTITEIKAYTDKVANVTARIDQVKEKVREAANYSLEKEALKLLEAIPIDDLSNDSQRIRVKTLKEAGFNNMASIIKASQYDLSAINGISNEQGVIIKETALEMLSKLKSTCKLKLSADDKSDELRQIIEALYKYKSLIELDNKVADIELRYTTLISKAIEDMSRNNDYLSWIFAKAEDKKKALDSYSYLKLLCKGDYSRSVEEISELDNQEKEKESLADHLQIEEAAMADFLFDPFSYTSAIEGVIPDLVIEGEGRYGLPESLAKEISSEEIKTHGLKVTLRRYQEWGVKYILHQKRVLLGDDMGLGKTIQAIASMVSLAETGAKHFLVIVPAAVLPNWCREIAEKSTLEPIKLHGSDKELYFEKWKKAGGVAVTTFETSSSLELSKDFKYDFLCVDEAHYIKNPNAKRSQNVARLANNTDRVLFMSGTPLENNVEEMVNLIDILNPQIASKIQNIAFISTAPQFREEIAPVYYRRKKEDVLTELPDKEEKIEWLDMSVEEEKEYEEAVMKRNFMKMRRISWSTNNSEDSCKANRLREIVTMAKEEGRKVLIFSFFLDTLDKVVKILGDDCIGLISGSIWSDKRQALVDEFTNSDTPKALCAQIQAGGTGLNIQAASVIVFCEPQIKPSLENQAIGRAYRMGQARNVLVFRLMCEDSVDERILEMLDNKQAQFEAFADDSVAAYKEDQANMNELSDTLVSDIIQEEIERIKKKQQKEERDESFKRI